MKQKLIAPPHSVPLKDQLLNYLRDPVYMIFLALTAIGSYGFWISRYSVSVDDLKYEYYYYGGLFSQGRFTGSLVVRLFHLTDNIIWIQDFAGIAFLCFAAMLLCAFFDSFYKTKSRIPQILFSCLLVSYPLHPTLFAYGGCSLMFGAGLTLAVCSLFLIKKYCEVRQIKYLIVSVIPLIFVTSWYESILVLYIQAVLAALLLIQLGAGHLKLSGLLANGLVYALPLTAAVVLEAVIAKLLMTALRLSPSEYTANQIVFFDKTADIRQLFYTNFLKAAVRALFFFPMIVFNAAVLLLFFMGLIQGIRRKSAVLFLSFFALIALNFVLPLFMGKVAPRTCQSFAFTVALAAYLLYDFFSARIKKPRAALSKLVVIGLACLIFAQAAQTNSLFTADDLRYQQEKAIITGVGNYLVTHDLDDKPVVFAGRVDLNETIKSRICVRKDNKLFQALLKAPVFGPYCRKLANSRKDPYALALPDTICTSYINHATYYKVDETDITLFFRFCGFDTVRYGTNAQTAAAQQFVTKLPVWPHQGSVRDMGDYVVVNLGRSTMGLLN